MITPLRALTLALAATAAGAHAHVSLEYQVAPAASTYKATFRVGHGCDKAPTRQISVAIPAGVLGAHPMPKPGWSLEIQRDKLPQPVANHGRTVTEDVTRVTWTARTASDMLPNEQYDEFVLVAQLPDRPGPMAWPVTQLCEPGRMDWTATLELLPASGGGHTH